MFMRFANAWLRFRYLYRGIGAKGTFLRIFQKIIAPIYRYEVGYITFRYVNPGPDPDVPGPDRDSMGTHAVVLETPAALRAFEKEIPGSIPLDRLKKHLSQGKGWIIVLARRPAASGQGCEVVGYRLCRRGYFSALGIRGTVSPEFLFILHNEVIPKYRGQRVQFTARVAMDDYCRRHGITKICGFVLAHNKPSLRSFTRDTKDPSRTFLGTVESVSILGGLFKRATPWEEIRRCLEIT